MSLDTRNKRMSMIGLGLAVRLVMPNPDGGFTTAADRQQLVHLYAGIAATPPVVPAPKPIPARVPYQPPQSRQEYDPAWTRNQLANISRALSPMVTRTVTANTSVLATDDTLLMDTTTANLTATLRPASQLQFLRVQIKNIGAHVAIISGTIDRIASMTLGPGDSCVIQSDGLAWRLLDSSLLISDGLNVRRYGAVGDGVADDTLALRATLAALGTTGGTLYNPVGIYKVTSTVAVTGNGVRWRGDGRLASILFNATSGVTNVTVEVDGSAQVGGASEGVSFSDIGFDSSYSGLGHLLLHNTARWTLSRLALSRVNCQISPGVYTGAITTHDAYTGTIDTVYCESSGGHGLLVGSTTNALSVIGSRFHASVGDGIRIAGNPVAGVGFVGCVAEGNGGLGLHVTGTAAAQGLTIGEGCYLEHNNFNGTPGPEILLATPTTGTATDGFLLDGCILDGATINTYPIRIEACTNGRIGKNHYMRFATAGKPQVVASALTAGLLIEWPDRGDTTYEHGVNTARGVRAHVNSASGGEEWEYGAGVNGISESGFHWYNRTLAMVAARMDAQTWGAASHPFFGLGASGPALYFGTGSPETVVTGNVGDLYLRTNGGAGTTLYVKESGTGNTGWIGK